MEKLSKSVKKKLRELAEIAYEKELTQYLEELYTHFVDWKNGKIDTFQLDELIHKYHNKDAREAYKSFAYSDIKIHLARAILNNLLTIEEIPDEVKPYISKLIEFEKEEDEQNNY